MKDNEYIQLLTFIKDRIQQAQVKTVAVANSQMLWLYWQLGNIILANQAQKGWGAKVIDLVSADLKKEFPQMKGFSARNILYMKQFAEAYNFQTIPLLTLLEEKMKAAKPMTQSLAKELLIMENGYSQFTQQPVAQIQNTENQEIAITQQAVAQLEEGTFLSSVISKISWSHHVVLMDKEPHLGKRLWYMINTLEHGNSRNVLSMQIQSGLFERQVTTAKINNFTKTLPPVQSDFANYLLKDPYIFDFVQAKEKADERNIEEQLTNHVTKFLLELGQGFAFIGRQVHFEIGNQDFYADLLFYHTKLHCYVVVELKARPFEPGDASQLNFYVNLVNDKMKSSHDNDTIGLLLCKGKNEVVAEYALKGYSAAIGVSDYQFSKAIPEELKSALPQIEEIEKEFENMNK
jgi:predicted nuclease of restriction endonuclease-like (RecB) superfamily